MNDLRHSEADHGCRAVCERQVVGFLFLIAHENLSKAIEPRVAALNDPPSGGLPAAFRLGLVRDLPHVGSVTALPHDGLGWFAPVGFVGAQVLRLPASGFGATHDNAVQGEVQQFHVMAIGAADDKRERGAKTVDQQTALGAFFSPDLSDWAQRPLVRVGPCP